MVWRRTIKMQIKDTYAAVYIPSDCSVAIAHTTEKLAKKFGSTTNYKAEGARVNDEGELIKEEITVIKAFYGDADYPHATAFIIDLAIDLKEELSQDCIAVEVGGEMIII